MHDYKVHPDGTHEYNAEYGPSHKTYEDLMAQRDADGVTGDVSPNVRNNFLLREFAAKFNQQTEGPTKEDAFFFLSKASMGIDKNGKPEHDIVMGLKGDPSEFATVLAFGLTRDPVLLHLFESAISVAKRHQLKKGLGDLFDGLASIFGHKSAQEWTDSVNKNRQDPKPETSTDKPKPDAGK